MAVRRLTTPAATIDLSPMTAELEALAAQLLTVQGGVTEALDGVDNTKTMIRNRDQRITDAQATATAAQAKADAVDVKRSEYEQALASSIADRASIHATNTAQQTQIDNLTTSLAGTLRDGSIGTLGVAAILLGGKATLTIPLATPMPNTSYRVRISHSAAVDLTKITITNVQRTTTAVTFTLTASGLALAAGTIVVLAVG